MGLGMCIIGISKATKTTELERVRENEKNPNIYSESE